MAAEKVHGLLHARVERVVREQRTHRRPHDFRVPEVHSSWQRDCRDDAESLRRPEDCPHVAWILNTVEHQKNNAVGYIIERSFRLFGNGDDTLGRIRIGGSGQFSIGRFNDFESTLGRFTSHQGIELGTAIGSADAG